MARAPAERMADAYGFVLRFVRQRGLYDALYPLLQYVHSEWLVRVGAARLSVHGQFHTTDNGPESLHRMLNEQAPRAHPNLWELIGKSASLGAAAAGEL